MVDTEHASPLAPDPCKQTHRRTTWVFQPRLYGPSRSVVDCNLVSSSSPSSSSSSPAFQCPFPDCGRRFSVMSNMRRHARVHTNALVDTPTDGEGAHHQAAGASGANPSTCTSSSSSQETSVSLSRGSGSGRRAGLPTTRGSIASSRGRSSSFSGPGSPIDMEMEMELAEGEGELASAAAPFSPPGPGRSAHRQSQPIAHIPPYGASSIPLMGSVHTSMPSIGPSLRSHAGGYATQPRHPVHAYHHPSFERNKPQASDSE